MADLFTVLAYDICTNTRICEIPANGLSFDSRLNDAGAIGFTLNLLDPKAAAQAAPFLAYVQNRVPVALYVDRDGVLVWGGYQTTGNYRHTAHTLPVQGKEWPGFFAQRLIAKPYDNTVYPNGVDPAALLATAVVDCQNPTLCGPGASLGIAVTGGSSGVPWIKPSYTLGQTYVSQVIADCTAGLSPGTGGVDVWTDVHWAGDSPSVTLRIQSPRAGRVAGTTGLTFELLEATDFTWPMDYQQACTVLYATGGGSGQVAPATAVPTGVPVGGLGQMPRLDRTVSHPDVTSPEFLAQLAQGEASEFAGALATPTVTIPTADPTNPLGTWIPGDDARLRAPAFELFPHGLDEYWRVVQQQVTVPDDGVPTVTLTFNPPPNF